jgi:hypothetical protein
MRTKPEVYVIESLDPDDEGNGRFEGAIIAKILSMHGKNCRYEYVRTRKAFEAAAKRFGRSRFRYLHVSSHGDPEGMCTTNQDEIDFYELGQILRPHLDDRRLFVSACELVHQDLASAVIPSSGCYSVIGPNEKIRFTDAAVLWSSLYHLMFTHNSDAMRRAELLRFLRSTSSLFRVSMSYFSRSTSSASGISRDLLLRDST